jgi:hypothetical protein
LLPASLTFPIISLGLGLLLNLAGPPQLHTWINSLIIFALNS